LSITVWFGVQTVKVRKNQRSLHHRDIQQRAMTTVHTNLDPLRARPQSRVWRVVRQTIFGGFVTYAAGCSDPQNPGSDDPCEVVSLKAIPSAITLPVLASSEVDVDVTLRTRRDPFTFLPDCNTQGKAIIGWRSERPEIATARFVRAQVGEIVAVAPGTTRVAITVGGVGARSNESTFVAVTVVQVVPTIRLSAVGMSLVVGQTATMTATVVDQGNRSITAQSTITWESSNGNAATVNRTTGLITAVAKGTSIVTATAVVAGITVSAAATITVADPPVQPVSGLTIEGPTKVRSGETILLHATATNAAGDLVSDPNLNWESNAPTKADVARRSADAHMADVSGGFIGKATITVRASSGKSASVEVEVTPGPVATVGITPPAPTLRAGKTVQLSASAFDAKGNIVPGQTFTWTSTTTSQANVDATGLVSGVNGGTPEIRATVVGTAVSGGTSVTVLARRVGYALANNPSAASYTPHSDSSFNSGGGSIAITRLATGSYRVVFPNQRPLSGEVETFMVSAYESNSYCKLLAWQPSGPNDLAADVRCFAFGGQPGDSKFTITLLSDGSLGNRFGFGLADQPSTAGPYTPASTYNASPTQPGPQLRVSRAGPGQYAVTFTGNGGTVLDPEGIMVTAYGAGNARCQPASELTNETILVRCWAGEPVSEYDNPVPVDSRFTIVMSDRGRGFGERGGFAFVDDSKVNDAGGTLTLPGFNGYNSTLGTVRAQHRGAGRYDVTFAGFSGAPSGGRFVAHVVDMDDDDPGYCSVTGWTRVGADLTVTVTCFHEEDGTPDDDAFYLFVIS
jgi:uncharacterized protein YjdB